MTRPFQMRGRWHEVRAGRSRQGWARAHAAQSGGRKPGLRASALPRAAAVAVPIAWSSSTRWRGP